jgi:hypothetical protein
MYFVIAALLVLIRGLFTDAANVLQQSDSL